MAEKPLQTPEKIVEDSPLEVVVTNPDEVALLTEDGGMIIDFEEGAEFGTESFDDNVMSLYSPVCKFLPIYGIR